MEVLVTAVGINESVPILLTNSIPVLSINTLAALAKLHSSVRELSSHGMRYYDVNEYSVEENIYDEDGEFVEHESIIEYSAF